MARDPVNLRWLSSRNRLVHWGVITGVVVVLWQVLAQQVRVVEAQAELAAVQSTLGALRTALVIDYLRQQPTLTSMTKKPLNPFDLLSEYPLNYRGILSAKAAETAVAGSWVFDPGCDCVGYRPQETKWFDCPSGDSMAWYQVSGAPGPLQLTARESYKWQGKSM